MSHRHNGWLSFQPLLICTPNCHHGVVFRKQLYNYETTILVFKILIAIKRKFCKYLIVFVSESLPAFQSSGILNDTMYSAGAIFFVDKISKIKDIWDLSDIFSIKRFFNLLDWRVLLRFSELEFFYVVILLK
jgi:hypothetical protein